MSWRHFESSKLPTPSTVWLSEKIKLISLITSHRDDPNLRNSLLLDGRVVHNIFGCSGVVFPAAIREWRLKCQPDPSSRRRCGFAFAVEYKMRATSWLLPLYCQLFLSPNWTFPQATSFQFFCFEINLIFSLKIFSVEWFVSSEQRTHFLPLAIVTKDWHNVNSIPGIKESQCFDEKQCSECFLLCHFHQHKRTLPSKLPPCIGGKGK